jgi:hypothetical protein
MATDRFVSDVLTIGRQTLGRMNENDPSASDEICLNKLNDFVSLSMPNDIKLFESFGTLVFTIDQTTSTSVDVVNGTITLQDACDQAGIDFINLSQEAYISLLDPVFNSISWNWLPVYQDPGEFYAIWGINNEEILIPGYPTGVLFFGDELVFRTIPNTAYQVRMYGYKKNPNYPGFDSPIQFDYWTRYLAYGWALNYANDFRFPESEVKRIEKGFSRERKLLLTRTHNQIKMSRCMPRF